MDAQQNVTTVSYAVRCKLFLISFIALSACLLLTAHAHAGIDTPMGFVLCQVVQMVYGNLGRGLATLAIIVIGVGAALGKVSWGMALTVGVGIGIIFNANEILVRLTNAPIMASCY